MECMCAQTRPRFILLSEKVLGNGVSTSSEKSPLPGAQRRSSPRHCITKNSKPSTLPTELFRPLVVVCVWMYVEYSVCVCVHVCVV